LILKATVGRLAFSRRQTGQSGQHDIGQLGVEAAVIQPQRQRKPQFGLLPVTLEHGHQDLDEHQHASELSDRFAGEPSGVAAAVHALVVLGDRGRDGRAQRRLALRDQLPDERMRAQISPRNDVERLARFVQSRIGMHHADIVQQRRRGERRQIVI